MSIGRPTQKLDHNLRQSIGAGVQSVFGRGGRTYYVLRHMTNSQTFKAGEEQKIIIDYIEIGRDPKCQVRFDETQRTVSRRHAAILREGNNWVLRNLSDKNPTLINGRPVNKQWFLTPGDQIQLSLEGPKIAFVMPTNSSVSSIPLTQRLNLFRKQALRPYKQALFAISMIFVLAISALSFWLFRVNQKNDILSNELTKAVLKAKAMEGDVDSLRVRQNLSEKEKDFLKSDIKRLGGNVAANNKKMKAMRAEQLKKAEEAKASGNIGSEELAASFVQFYPDIYYIRATRLVLEFEDERETIEAYPLSGTGFLLSDGRFVTARHIIEPWFYYDLSDPDPVEVLVNALVNNGGKAWLEFEAFASNDRQLRFNSREFKCNRTADKGFEMENPDGGAPLMVTRATSDDGRDWAYYKPGSRTGTITAEPGIARTLPNGADLRILGFPYGLGTENAIEPIQTNVKTASGSLQNEVIVVSGGGIEPGHSGGPAFYFHNGQYKVIGIVSSKVNSFSFLVPIANIR